VVGYNVQIAVDAEHHLIVAHEVINQGHDRSQLAPMALKAQEATGCEQVTALADRGYFSGDQVLSCEGTGVMPIVPKTLTSSGTKRGLFTRQDFLYDAEHDHYTCPAGAKLTKIHRRGDHTEDFDRYRHLSACFTCRRIGRPLRHRMVHRRRRSQIRHHRDEVMIRQAPVEIDRHGRTDERSVRPASVPDCHRDLSVGPAADPGVWVGGDFRGRNFAAGALVGRACTIPD
jgi:hypothetical protein